MDTLPREAVKKFNDKLSVHEAVQARRSLLRKEALIDIKVLCGGALVSAELNKRVESRFIELVAEEYEYVEELKAKGNL